MQYIKIPNATTVKSPAAEVLFKFNYRTRIDLIINATDNTTIKMDSEDITKIIRKFRLDINTNKMEIRKNCTSNKDTSFSGIEN